MRIPIIALLFAGCAAAGTQPHDMSAAQHEERAAHPCTTEHPCWQTSRRPTPMDSQRASLDRQSAAEHRTAAHELEEAEARSCSGISAEDRDISPFHRRQDIARIEPLMPEPPHAAAAQPIGVTVIFQPVEGLTVESLQRIIDCHLARNAVLGHEVPWMPECPLVPNGVSATVRTLGDRLAVDIHATSPATQVEIRRRADRLASRSE